MYDTSVFSAITANRVSSRAHLVRTGISPVGFFFGDRTMGPEIWKDIEGYCGMYEVSDKGNIRSWKLHKRSGRADKPRIMSPCMEPCGRKTVMLWNRDGSNRRKVHRLVLLAFVGPCPNTYEACHNDGNASNNTVGNLRWDTHISNCRDRKKHGKERCTFKKGNRCHAKMTEGDVRAIRKIGWSMTQREIASMYPISESQVSNILCNISWKL